VWVALALSGTTSGMAQGPLEDCTWPRVVVEVVEVVQVVVEVEVEVVVVEVVEVEVVGSNAGTGGEG